MSERKVWGVYDCRDYYVNVLHDNKLYADEAEADRVCDALNKCEGYGFRVDDHVLVEAIASTRTQPQQEDR